MNYENALAKIKMQSVTELAVLSVLSHGPTFQTDLLEKVNLLLGSKDRVSKQGIHHALRKMKMNGLVDRSVVGNFVRVTLTRRAKRIVTSPS